MISIRGVNGKNLDMNIFGCLRVSTMMQVIFCGLEIK